MKKLKLGLQSKGQYSLEDIKRAFHTGRLYQGREGDTSLEELIQSLSTQQLPKFFEPEYEIPYTDGYTEDRVRRFYGTPILKTITNSEGKQEIQGRYVY